ncbi:hypothetical protein MCCS_08160 [Macrococcoides canis]|uniref:Uncharacterized protein n=1 Tax=Macrococcoides canis TaxID=1855823 RepID=A0A1W7AAB6_9STAP|nr:hypothetical protein MCCS_08160 [Macrococcus canis]
MKNEDARTVVSLGVLILFCTYRASFGRPRHFLHIPRSVWAPTPLSAHTTLRLGARATFCTYRAPFGRPHHFLHVPRSIWAPTPISALTALFLGAHAYFCTYRAFFGRPRHFLHVPCSIWAPTPLFARTALRLGAHATFCTYRALFGHPYLLPVPISRTTLCATFHKKRQPASTDCLRITLSIRLFYRTCFFLFLAAPMINAVNSTMVNSDAITYPKFNPRGGMSA